MITPLLRSWLARCCLAALAITTPMWPPLGFAHAQAIDPEIAEAVTAVRGAPAHDAYVALRQLWQLWDRADPVQVEATLASLATDKGLAPQTRVYAGILEAYARRRRGDLAGSTKQLAELGFVSRWMVIGPFDNDNRTGLAQRMIVEDELAQPIVLDRSVSGKQRAVRWREAPDVHRFGYLDLGAMLRPQADICAFASSFVKNPDARPRTVTLWAGATGAFKLYLGEDLVLEDAAYRQLDADRFATTVTLAPGVSRITAKVCADESPPTLSLRIGGADGAPDPAIETSASVEASTAAARTHGQGGEKQKARAGGRVVGPLQHFESALLKAGEKPPAKLLESFARYLSITGGDAEASHQARDLGRRAADAEPTVERLLLASRLAEDRNGRRELIDRIEVLVKSEAERLQLRLEEARLIRTGPNPRDAFPLYDEVLRLRPSDVEATLGKVDLYLEAGLGRTALTTLERAVETRPSSVALLRALAGQLRALGRDRDAADVEARYAALRFDDGGFLEQRIKQALAERDRAAVERWSRRLLDSDPSSLWAHDVVARARLGLGDLDVAMATYRRALDVAPEDIATLRAMADLHGVRGQRVEQLALLRQILRIAPQAKSVRAYVDHIAPESARGDEKYAWPAEKFLERRAITDDSLPMRTLRKLTVTTVFDNGLASTFKQLVFQPLTEEAAAQARNYAFVYHADRQVAVLRTAKVYRRDGRVDEAVESGEGPANDPSINMYTLQRTFYVQFPRLDPGDVVELRYRVDDVAARNEMSDYFAEIEYLQSTDPVGSAEYVLIAPKQKKLHISTGPAGAPGLGKLEKTTRDQGDKRIYRFAMSDVPPIDVEPRMPRLTELLMHVHVSTFANWSEVGAWYWGLAKDKLDVDDDVRRIARELVKGKETDREKLAAIYHYAATETRYVALEFGIEGIRPRRAALTLARGWGDCKDKATLIASLLREVGVDAELVLVRTGMRGGFDPATASLAPFDHAIAYVPSLDLFVDGTAEHTGSEELPSMDRSSMGLRISGQKGLLVTLPEPAASASREEREVVLKPAKDGALKFTAKLTNRGVDAPDWRRRYQAEATRRERVSSDLAESLGPVELLAGKPGLHLSDLDAVEEPVRLEVAGEATAQREGGALSIPSGPSWQLVRNLAARATRRHPLLVGPRREHEERWTVTVPPGLRVVSLPKTTTLTEPFGSYSLAVQQEGPKVTITTKLTLSEARVSPAAYAAFRRFCQAVDASAGARLLLSE